MAQSYVAECDVEGKKRAYTGAAHALEGGAENRRGRIQAGLNGAYWRPEGGVGLPRGRARVSPLRLAAQGGTPRRQVGGGL